MSEEVFVFEISENNFAQAVIFNSHKLPVVVEFMAVWSEPCVMMENLFSGLAKEFAGEFVFAKVDIDEQEKLKEQYGIKNLPTTMVFKDGEPVRTEEGQLQEVEARALLADFGVYRESDTMREDAREKHLSGDTPAAIMLLSEAIQKDPGNTRIAMDMTQIFIDLGETEQALGLFAKLPATDKETEMGKALSGQLSFAQLAKDLPDLASLTESLTLKPDDNQARFDMAVQQVVLYNYEDAVNHLFGIMESEPEFKEGAAKEMIITITNMLAPTHYELSAGFRQRLANLVSS
ncbi:MAG: Unknown protein [uncultured Thiotrichaceae bacterium]|uniref:Thioredoxin domain-containing protein n=1 Tax=uncultured Thiotrichaceae bacterium TaxID=298394 RepID=A0A6S6SZ76_9GAMM|nr:MAG: Unknown protein [uncultured Thiotrichaceae bacterium]